MTSGTMPAMFVQLMRARVTDGEGLRRQWDAWHRDVAPGASGWLGSTAGITSDGGFAAAARFESEAAALANQDRPEQRRWWAATEPFLDRPHIDESSDVTLVGAGGADDAGFVQMMRATVADRAAFEAVEEEVGPLFMRHRPDFLAGYRVWLPGGVVQAVDFFTSEAEARAGEGREPPAELQAGFGRWMAHLSDTAWFDLPDPWIIGP